MTGEPFLFTPWDPSPWLPGEPNDAFGEASEQILEMYPDGWNDIPADHLRNVFMVEYEDCQLVTGKATFGFVSKYKKGAQAPTGNTEFQFHAGDMNFHSDSYDWLVVNQNGARAQFKGEGTINGALAPSGEYFKFILWATDDVVDEMRIKIWYENGGEIVVYDNGFSGSGFEGGQPLDGGSVIIHTNKKK